MNIITLTTDLGLTDHYVAAIKGQLFSQVPSARIIDISHDVSAFDIAEAAYYVNNIMGDFPEGTIHFLGVDCVPLIGIGQPEHNFYPLVMKLKGQYFVGCDNGIFSLLKDYLEAETIIRIDGFTVKNALRFPVKNLYIPTMARISAGESLESLGEEVKTVRKRLIEQPVIQENIIKGSVMHIDKYGNVIVNITERLFTEIGKGNPFTIYFQKFKYFIERISSNYYDVPEGEKLALFNANGYMEIAINKGVEGNGGGAASLLGLHVKDAIRIEFHPKGSKDNIEALFPKLSL